MILNPAVIALLTAAALIAAMVLYATWHAGRILDHWDLSSGSELQLALERRTYLISTLLTYALLFQALSLVLLVYVADSLHVQIAGAMCAVGTFHVNSYGYATLILKIINFLLAGLWLILNHVDTRGYDYPLIRVKYALLMVLALPLVVESVHLWLYFLSFESDVITSCCGSLFSAGSKTVSAELATLPPRPTLAVFAASIVATFYFGLRLLRGQSLGYAFGVAAALVFAAALPAIIAYIAPLFYELPHHHCPFCLLHAEYHYIGYALYPSLFIGALAGMGCGLLAAFRTRPSLAQAVPRLQKRLALVCLLGYGSFVLIVVVRMLTTDFKVFS